MRLSFSEVSSISGVMLALGGMWFIGQDIQRKLDDNHSQIELVQQHVRNYFEDERVDDQRWKVRENADFAEVKALLRDLRTTQNATFLQVSAHKEHTDILDALTVDSEERKEEDDK